jgi:glyoxylase-like metal-dependent hydrolase (beta-lactamase superfamily II)
VKAIEVAAGVFAIRHEELDLTTGLVVGEGACLVIDTAGDHVQGTALSRTIREITPHPWRVVYSHAHFDHYYGTSAFMPCEVWAHKDFRFDADEQAKWVAKYRQDGKPEISKAIQDTGLVAPTNTFDTRTELTIGGRTVVLHHFGPAHSFSDTVAHVPDAGVVFAGDLVEHPEFIAESFGDGDVTQWPMALEALLALDPRVVVPGHGSPVDKDFAAAQREILIAGWTSPQ